MPRWCTHYVYAEYISDHFVYYTRLIYLYIIMCVKYRINCSFIYAHACEMYALHTHTHWLQWLQRVCEGRRFGKYYNILRLCVPITNFLKRV